MDVNGCLVDPRRLLSRRTHVTYIHTHEESDPVHLHFYGDVCGLFFFSQFPSRLFDQFRGFMLSLLLGMWIGGGRGGRRLNGKYWGLYILMQTEPPAGVDFKGLARLNFTHFPIS